MPEITINGKKCTFEQGQTILQVANDHKVEIPYYCYHDGLSIVASCRICLVEVWAPNPRNDNKLEPIPKLLPSCQTTAGDGQVVRADSPKAVQSQKMVMEDLLINHPLDCPVCDQSGECYLQDYSYKYGRGVSRFEEQKVKQPKKDLGPNVYLYADRCIMCTRCTRFTREVSGTAELMVAGRGNQTQIDVFPGHALDNELASNVIDICPVGALLDKDFLFAQRVWYLKSTPSIDGITASGDNIWIEHNEGKIYRLKPRTNLEVNKWWITDEVRYGWKHIHAENRLRSPMRRRHGALSECDFNRAYDDALAGLSQAAESGGRLAALISPMLSCEDAFLLARLVRAIDDKAILALGPVPRQDEDKVFPPNLDANNPKAFVMRAEKAPNARGVRRVLEAVNGGSVDDFNTFLQRLSRGEAKGLILTGNYPSDWATDKLRAAAADETTYTVLIDTLAGPLVDSAQTILPGATWAEKAGTFENDRNRLQAFEQAIPVIEMAKSEGQIALDMLARLEQGVEARAPMYNAANVRMEMAETHPDTLGVFTKDVHLPLIDAHHEPDMQVVEL
ncbi:MAG: hypothetical protein EA376_07920 [Phycisphaeraceae bacterium]|nr:MAG: hypothetical protein EA376_07920 [Phycisphaeraceae bacterium]